MKIKIKGFFPSFFKLMKTIFPLILIIAFVETKSHNLPLPFMLIETILAFIPVLLISFVLWKLSTYKRSKK